MADARVVKLSNKTTVEIVELNGREQRTVSRYLPPGLNPDNKIGMILAIGETQAICCVRKINDRMVNPCTSDLDFDLVLDALDGMELLKLANEAGGDAPIPDGDTLKNSLTDPGSAQ